MRIFLTGATGYVGSAVLEAALRGGHQVTALVRDPEKAERVSARGVTPVIGELSKPPSYAGAAEACDVIIHTAYEPSKRGPKVDRMAVEACLAAGAARRSAGRQARFIYTSDLWVLGHTAGRASEDAPLSPTPLTAWRPEHERLVLDGAGGALSTVVVRPAIVYGGARGIIGDMLRDAANGLVRIVGDGANHWPCVYDRDLADLYVRLASAPDASGVYHANDEADERVSDIVEAIAAHVTRPPDVRHMPMPEARKKLGPYADALALDQIVRSPRARALGWAPTLRSVAANIPRLFEEFRTAREAA